MDNSTIASISGFVLFVISESLAFVPIPQNGILHSLLTSFRSCSSDRKRDVEIANEIVNVSQDVEKMFQNKIFMKNITQLYLVPEFNKFVDWLSNANNVEDFLKNLPTKTTD